MGEIQLSVQELFAMPESSYQLVDIRDERARSYGVIPGSVALSAEELPESQEIDKNKTVVIYCQKGEMSVPVAEALQEAGVDAKSLNGGYLAWLMEAMKQKEEAKKEEAETALTKTSRWSKLWNAIKHPIQTIKAARAGKAEKIAKCDFAWKNLFANKTWDEIEAKSMDGRFTKKEEKAKQEEPSKEEPKQEKAPDTEKPTVEDIDKPVEPMWTDLQSEEEAKKEEAEQAAKENNEKALVKTSRWSKLWNAIKHPIQTIKAAREKAKSGEGKRIIKNGDAIKKDGEPEKTEAQSVDAFIAKLRQMSEKEAAKDVQNKDNKEQPDYSKYVARHARKVEAQKQRDDEGR